MTSCAPPPAASLDARADEIVERIQPNAQSERSRREVFQYIKRMVESTGAQVSFKIFQSHTMCSLSFTLGALSRRPRGTVFLVRLGAAASILARRRH